MSKAGAILITFFLGGLGVHRFLTGKIGTGIIWLLTGGACGIGWLVDLIMVIAGKYTDKDGNVWGYKLILYIMKGVTNGFMC